MTDRRSSEANSGRKKWRLKSIFSWSRKDRRTIGNKTYGRLHDSGIEDVSKDFVNVTPYRSSFRDMKRAGSFAITEDRFTEGSLISDVEDDRSCVSYDESLQEGILIHRLVTCADRSTQTGDDGVGGRPNDISFVRVALIPFVIVGLLILHLLRCAGNAIIRRLTPTVTTLSLESYWKDLGILVGIFMLPLTPLLVFIEIFKRALQWRPTIQNSPLSISRNNPIARIVFMIIFPIMPILMIGEVLKQLSTQKRNSGPVAPPRSKRQSGGLFSFFRSVSSSKRSVSAMSSGFFPRPHWNKGARPSIGRCPCKCVVS